jgi:hypothetical protein
MIAKKKEHSKTDLHKMIKHVERQISNSHYEVTRFTNSTRIDASRIVEKAETRILNDRSYLSNLRERLTNLEVIESAFDKKDESLEAVEMQVDNERTNDPNFHIAEIV